MNVLRPLTVALALAAVLWPAAGEVSARGEAPSGPAASDFGEAVNAWQGRNAAALRKLIPEKERLQIDLVGTGGGRVQGTSTPENAEAVLKEYFAKVESPTLKDVSPEDARIPTRSYEYTYRPTGAESRTTKLAITLRALPDGGYGLAAVLERVRKP
jgi:hypothetical protein